ncbi:MAG: thermonuclease family protein [Rhodospirillales bacterium]|nr:thermonuclease family protein [Rhodospirillales bacterium]MDP7215872.1 thermonuclease family protein [Rhodospirillales bacterium]HJP53468.1 thermonuclease family protein [Rhodospirillales bacterium]
MHADASITGKACVVDGDSLAAGGRLNNEQWCRGGVQARLSGIDAPEWNQTCTDAGGKEWARGKAAKKAMARMVEGKIVVCQERARDSYKRSVAVCLAGGRDLDRELVAAGLAVAYRRYTTMYVGEEDAARTAGLGMWAGKFTTPEIWRRTNK